MAERTGPDGQPGAKAAQGDKPEPGAALRPALEKLLRTYEAYYAVYRNGCAPPFAAQADFSAHGERYFLSRQAKYAEVDSREYVYFVLEDAPGPERLRELAALAWEDGLRRVRPAPNHRCSDILLIVLAASLPPESAKEVKRIRYYKSYRMTLQGWSHFRMAVCEPERGGLAYNPQGRDLARFLGKVFLQSERK